MKTTQTNIPVIAQGWQTASIQTMPNIQVLTNVSQLTANSWVMACRGGVGDKRNFLALLAEIRSVSDNTKEVTVAYNTSNLHDYTAHVSRYATLYGYGELIATLTFKVVFDPRSGEILDWDIDGDGARLRFLTPTETTRVQRKVALDIEKIEHGANVSGYFEDLSGVCHKSWQKRDAANRRFQKTRQ